MIIAAEVQDGRKVARLEVEADGSCSLRQTSTAQIAQALRSALLPEGYPHSVSPDYLSEFCHSQPAIYWAAVETCVLS